MAGEHDLPVARLDRYLAKHVPGFNGLVRATKCADGQSNPTFVLEAATGRYILRRKPAGNLLKSAHAVDREYRVIRALADTNVPVPQALHLCEDESLIGSVFYVMEFVTGRTFWDPALPELDNDGRRRCYTEMNQTLAAIHSVDVDAAGLSNFGRPGNYFERQFDRWCQQYRASETDKITAMEEVITWLSQNMVPDDGRVALVHGDYRLDNFMFDANHVEIRAVLDWELSTLGHPFADLAFQVAIWRMPPTAALRGLKGVDRDALGIPSDLAYLDDYCARMGHSGIRNWHFYLAFSLFRIAAIVQGVKKRALDGTASSARALEVGELVTPLAAEACAVISQS